LEESNQTTVEEESVSEEHNVDKVSDEQSSQGRMGQRYLASGEAVSMRMWENEQPGEPKPEAAREYETVGYVLAGRAELHLEGEVVELSTGDSWTVPRGATHTYKILEPFTAVEATSPPAEERNRDEP
jgi:quercetin dioxygenase-like cupin family protein